MLQYPKVYKQMKLLRSFWYKSKSNDKDFMIEELTKRIEEIEMTMQDDLEALDSLDLE